MKKSYVFIYSDTFGSRDEVKAGLNRIESIADWRFELPNCFYLISELSAEELALEVRKQFGDKIFLILQHSSNSQGWLSSESWFLLNNFRRKPKS